MLRLLRAAAAVGAAALIFSLLKKKEAEKEMDGESMKDKAEETVKEMVSSISE